MAAIAACASEPERASTTVATPSTVLSTTSTTTSTTGPPGVEPSPAYFRFDQSGLYLVDENGETQLEEAGVTGASSDAMGGIVYSVAGEAWRPALQWHRAGAEVVETLPYDTGFVAPLSGGPVLVTRSGDCEEHDTMTLMRGVDLRTAVRRTFGCFGGEDGGASLVSGGGDLLVAIRWLAVGSNGTDRDLVFYDASGREIDHPHNPVPETCEPCDLDVRVSPDGTLLAYRIRPDAKWSTDLEEQRRLDEMTGDEWWASSRHIDSQVSVIDLGTGATRYTTTVPAGTRLADFDGRHLVLETCEQVRVEEGLPVIRCASQIVDSSGHAPTQHVEGRARLVSTVGGEPPGTDIFPPYLRVTWPGDGATLGERRIQFTGLVDSDARLVAAGRYEVDVPAHGEWSILLVLNSGGNVATFTATDPAGNETVVRVRVTLEAESVLRPGGIGAVDFGTPFEDAMDQLNEMLGPPSRIEDVDVHGCYEFEEDQRSATWDGFGVRAIFTDVDDPIHLAGWQLFGPGVTTESGMRWGSSVADLRAAHPPVVFGINEWAPEFSIETGAGMLRGGFDWPDFVADMQVALNEHGYRVDVTGAWDGPTTQAVLDLIDDLGLHGPHEALSALGIPSPEVTVTWIHAGQEGSCA